MRNISLLIGLFFVQLVHAQSVTKPINGTTDKTDGYYAFTNAVIHVSSENVIKNGTLIIKNGKVVKSQIGKHIPKGAVEVDLKGKHIYPSFIELYSDYGIQKTKKSGGFNPYPQLESRKKGAYAWNESIKPEVNAKDMFDVSEADAKGLRNIGFGTVLSQNKDGISRGTGVLTTLNTNSANESIINPTASAHFSFSKGSSRQSYPSAQMGIIALLRQTYYDALWYAAEEDKIEVNLSLLALNQAKSLPQFMDVGNYKEILRADKIGDEFGIQYIFKGNGDEYKRVTDIKAAGGAVMVPVTFPKAFDITDPYETMLISLADLKHWELAPTNLKTLADSNVVFTITTSGLKNKGEFLANIRKAIKHGLAPEQALKALTETPAGLINAADKVGKLENGMIANFFISSKEIFDAKAVIYENWVQGKQYIVKDKDVIDIRGDYNVKIAETTYKLSIKGSLDRPKASVKIDTNKVKATVKRDGKLIALAFNPKDSLKPGNIRLSGRINFDSGVWDGDGKLQDGKWITWTAVRSDKFKEKTKPAKTDSVSYGKPFYPNMAFGQDSIPETRTILIKNATVWTNEAEGIMENTSVLVRNGKIVRIGSFLDVADKNAIVIDGTGKHLTCGIIDEHSHIAANGGVNESGQAISAEVSLETVINPDDINIYRQLSGGVTCSQILHGSANPIGGKSAIIKLKWGANADDMIIDNSPKFIKFALGENVKQSNWGEYNTIRFPQTRMGVEQVYYDGFLKAREYEKQWNAYNGLKKKAKQNAIAPRRDLELETLLEILNKERFITCHSYVQSEINMLMHVADSMGFTLNTFTHILEGYKVADKMKKHGAGASTFSDWWAYKYEVKDAIPYNAAMLNSFGIVTAINSDDAEMARRLNQEAAKSVKYGGASEEDAWKMVTLNPARLLHLDDRMGSVKIGKDADLVLWNDNPLSVYARAEKTIVDGILFFDFDLDKVLQERNRLERARLINKMATAIANGAPVRQPQRSSRGIYNCIKE